MKCPACTSMLTAHTESGVELNVCKEGCGGVWFDRTELEKFDHQKDASLKILATVPNKRVAVDMAKTRNCPRCASQPLHRFQYAPQPELELDECFKCGGIWLDLGELALFRESNRNASHMDKVYDDFVAKYSASKSGKPVPPGAKAVLGLIFHTPERYSK